MAIKGKGKPRRKRTTAPPRPIYVQRKKPLIRRRGFQAAVLLVLLAGVGAIVWAALDAASDRRREAARQERRQEEGTIVGRFGNHVIQAMQPVSQQSLNTLLPFPNLQSDMGRLKSGDLEAEDAIESADENARLAAAAATQINEFIVAREIRGHPDLVDLTTAQTQLTDAINVFAEVSRVFKLAAQQDDTDVRDAIIVRAEALWNLGQQQFQRGWQTLINLATEYGLPPPQAPPAPPTPPTPTPTPSESPSPTPSESPSPSPEQSSPAERSPTPSAS
jgi:hypothetical protein